MNRIMDAFSPHYFYVEHVFSVWCRYSCVWRWIFLKHSWQWNICFFFSNPDTVYKYLILNAYRIEKKYFFLFVPVYLFFPCYLFHFVYGLESHRKKNKKEVAIPLLNLNNHLITYICMILEANICLNVNDQVNIEVNLNMWFFFLPT